MSAVVFVWLNHFQIQTRRTLFHENQNQMKNWISPKHPSLTFGLFVFLHIDVLKTIDVLYLFFSKSAVLVTDLHIYISFWCFSIITTAFGG